MCPETAGRKLLIKWMAKDPKQRTGVAIAKALGVRQPNVSDWLRRASRPDCLRWPEIARLTDGEVPADSWMTAKERAEREKVRPFDAT